MKVIYNLNRSYKIVLKTSLLSPLLLIKILNIIKDTLMETVISTFDAVYSNNSIREDPTGVFLCNDH